MNSRIYRRLLPAILLQLVCLPLFATTWYVRPDGGTRSQCDGKTDAAHANRTGHRCAFNDVRSLYMDGSYATGTKFPAWGWVISGGDTVILRGSIATGVSYRIGINDSKTRNWVGGIWGNQFGSGMPAPPSGTAGHPTRILGENWQNCSAQSARTQLRGGWGVSNIIDLSGTSYVDVECLDLTDFTPCTRNESAAVPCEVHGVVVADFAADGIRFSNKTTHLTLNNIRAHGLAVQGFFGPTGDGTVMKNIVLVGNGSSGWNADRGDRTTGTGSLLVQNFDISWNGCAEEYPIKDPLPYEDCRDDSSGGYGDGFGTATVPSPAPGWQVHFDQGVVSYNTQDGLDALHIKGPGSSMTVTRTLAFGNEGNQIKVGGSKATVINNVIVGNCEAMRRQTIPGTPAGFGSVLRDPCRAGNVAVVLETTPGDPATYQFNTVYSSGSIGLEIEYATGDHGSGNMLDYDNNIFVGFKNPGGEYPSAVYSTSDAVSFLTSPGASWSNNVTFERGGDRACPHRGERRAICGDPGLVDETYHAYGYGNMSPKAGSRVRGAGTPIAGVTIDFAGKPRGNPPTIGALE
ncbi:MAG TPA: hypothetical protein VHY48_00230 [Acidobacteriaceae bacterium]|jgi:hypothetical protein|nr:hypothetical protein [Acidobacteriaceae bacterium]